jgi:signal transduction histidine kinase/ligand-binding sensor domain-containing protein
MKIGLNHKDTKPRRPLISLCLCVFVVWFLILARPNLSTFSQLQTEFLLSTNLHQWGAVTLFHGLPSDHVRAIAQDPDGAMWFGTDSGLAKYDGRRVQKLATEGVAAPRIRALKLDRDGILWIGSDAGAARLINSEIKPIPETQSSVITSIITPESGHAVMASEQGEIFDCSTAHDGSLSVRKIKPEDHPLLTIESRGHAPLQLTSLALIENNLIVGTHSRGLIAIDPAQLKTGSLTAELVKEVPSRPRAFFVEAIETDQHGHIWFGSETSVEDSGLYYARDLIHPEKIGAGLGKVNALAFDQSGDLWVGTEARGVFVYREGQRLEHFTFENTAGGLRSNQVHSIFIDREGVVWFATDRGVSRFDPAGVRAEAISSEPESNVSRVLFQSSDSTLWCGTNRGLFARRFANNDSGWQEVPEFKGRIIHSIGEEPSGRLLIGTASGLYAHLGALASLPASRHAGRMPALPAGHEFTRFESSPSQQTTPDNIRAICLFQGVTYLANFDRGVERLEGTKRKLVWPDDSADPSTPQVVSLHAEKDRLWIGTAQAGVFSFDGKRVAVDHAFDELIGRSVWSIEGTTDGVLWLATERGLYALKSGRLQQVVEDLDARCVVAATDSNSDNAVWCATVGGGVYKVLPGNEPRNAPGSGPGSAGILPASAPNWKSVLTSRVDTEQGLPSQNSFTVMSIPGTSRDAGLWIGTNRGVAHYQPGLVAPVLNVTRVMGKRIYGAEELPPGLKLEYPQNSLAIDVAANSSRTFAEQFQYAFTVRSRAGEVVREKLSHDSQLLVENLRPGSYEVEARAYTRDLIASDPIRFEFAVAGAPFPWTSTTLSVLLLLALAAMWWGYRQNKRLAGTNIALAETRMQLANETETERRRIARDLHDQTLADLRRLMLLTDQLPPGSMSENSNGHVDASKLRVEIESVSTEIRRICEDLSPSALANVGLAAALEWALADAAGHQPPEKRFDYEFVTDTGVEERLRLDPASQIQIYRIVQEAISNVCRHSGATQVRLNLSIENAGELLIELEDNGGGFDLNKLAKKGRGLTNIRSRASVIEASVTWSARPACGTLFTLQKSVEFHR